MHEAHFEHQKSKRTIYEVELDFSRTKRIYATLNKLTNDAIGFLKSGNLKEFSFASDRIRPMLCYIADNKVKISKHLESEVDSATSNEIKKYASSLVSNLRTIEQAQSTMNQIKFNPVFFMSDELTNAFLDNQIPLSWEFNHDLIIIKNLENRRLIDKLVERGQSRIFLVGGTLDENVYDRENYPVGLVLHKTDDYKEIVDLIPLFTKQPPRRICVLDCGAENTDKDIMDDLYHVIERGRQAAWLRFNTLNRGDAVKILDNLFNITNHTQTSQYHNKFTDKTAIIVCPGPSLSKNVHLLKDVKGKALIMCVLHAYRALKAAGVEPDIVIHTDPFNLQKLNFERNGKTISQWDEWIEKDDFSKTPFLVTSSMGSPAMFGVPTQNVMWMSPGVAIGDLLPIDVFDYLRVGGSVSHSAFDLAVEFGCETVVLLGQDLALSVDGEVYADNAKLDASEERIKALGETFKVKGSQDDEVTTNNAFFFFAKSYSRFAEDLKDRDVGLFNCTEGGMFIEGWKHCSFKELIAKKELDKQKADIQEIFDGNKRKPEDIELVKKNMRKYIIQNKNLGTELNDLIKKARYVVESGDFSDHQLAKFDKLQNTVIKKMKKNGFFELGLQKEMYMLQSGLRADRSLEGQLGYHLDFLVAAQKFTNKFRKAFRDQFNYFSSN